MKLFWRRLSSQKKTNYEAVGETTNRWKPTKYLVSQLTDGRQQKISILAGCLG
jgi:hypothetical protein